MATLVIAVKKIEVSQTDVLVELSRDVTLRPKPDRRRTIADHLYKKMVEKKESFWDVAYPLYMQREITRGDMLDLVRKGLEDSRGNYKVVTRIFNMESSDYKRFLSFLRKHGCQLEYRPFRTAEMVMTQLREKKQDVSTR